MTLIPRTLAAALAMAVVAAGSAIAVTSASPSGASTGSSIPWAQTLEAGGPVALGYNDSSKVITSSSVKKGSYAFNAKLVVDSTAPVGVRVTCFLEDNQSETFDFASTEIPAYSGSIEAGTIALSAAETLGGTVNVEIACSTTGGSNTAEAYQLKLTALRLGTLKRGTLHTI